MFYWYFEKLSCLALLVFISVFAMFCYSSLLWFGGVHRHSLLWSISVCRGSLLCYVGSCWGFLNLRLVGVHWSSLVLCWCLSTFLGACWHSLMFCWCLFALLGAPLVFVDVICCGLLMLISIWHIGAPCCTLLVFISVFFLDLLVLIGVLAFLAMLCLCSLVFLLRFIGPYQCLTFRTSLTQMFISVICYVLLLLVNVPCCVLLVFVEFLNLYFPLHFLYKYVGWNWVFFFPIHTKCTFEIFYCILFIWNVSFQFFSLLLY